MPTHRPTLAALLSAFGLALLAAVGPARAEPAASAPTPDWEQVATEMIQRPEFEALPLQVRLPRGMSLGGSPVEMQFQAGQCILNLRTRGNPVADLLVQQVDAPDRTLWMQTVIAHEIAHCWRWQEHQPALHQLAALTAPSADPRGAAAHLQRQLHAEESFADVAALAWVRRVAPSRYDAMLDAFQRLRGNMRLSAGPHDTRAALGRLRREGFAADLPIYAAATELLERPAR